MTSTWTLFGVRQVILLEVQRFGRQSMRGGERDNLEVYLDYKCFRSQSPPECPKL